MQQGKREKSMKPFLQQIIDAQTPKRENTKERMCSILSPKAKKVLDLGQHHQEHMEEKHDFEVRN